jgi:hypothetical protein
MWSAAAPADAALSTGLESYRREVQRRCDLSGRVLWWSLGPVVFAIATLLVPLASLGIENGFRRMIPFLSLLVIWIVCVFVIRMRNRRELRREIAELNEIDNM